MSRMQYFLVGVVLAQVYTIVWLATKKPDFVNRPPLPELQHIDGISASEIKAFYDKCQTNSPTDLVMLAEMYFAHGFYPEAESCFARACELTPSNGDYAFDRAFAAAHAGRVESAIEGYQKALELGLKDAKAARYFLGRCFLRSNQIDEARKTFRSIDDLPAANFELSRMNVRAEQYEKASQSLAELCRGNPDAAEYWYWAARANRALDRPLESRRMTDRAARSLSRGDTPFNTHSQRWYQVLESFGASRLRIGIQERLKNNELNGLRDLAESALESEWYPQGADALAEIEMQSNQAAAAVERLTRLIEFAGPTLDRCWRLGDAQALNNQPDAAEASWYRGLALGRGKYADLAELHRALAQWQQKNRMNDDKAQEHFAAAEFNEGLSQFANGRYGEAQPSLERSLQLDPNQSQAWFYLGEARRLTTTVTPPAPGKSAEAALQQCLRLSPNHGRAKAAMELLE